MINGAGDSAAGNLAAEDSPSGLGRTLGKRVGGNPSRVRISHPPRSVPTRFLAALTLPRGPRRAGGPEIRIGRLGLSLSAVSVALVATVAALGRSAAVPVRPGHGFPPYAGTAHPSAGLVTGLLVAAVVTGSAGVLLGWVALRRGWRPPVRRLVIAGCLVAGAMTLLPHIGSADPESYAAYGHEAAIGIDPYAADPS